MKNNINPSFMNRSLHQQSTCGHHICLYTCQHKFSYPLTSYTIDYDYQIYHKNRLLSETIQLIESKILFRLSRRLGLDHCDIHRILGNHDYTRTLHRVDSTDNDDSVSQSINNGAIIGLSSEPLDKVSTSTCTRLSTDINIRCSSIQGHLTAFTTGLTSQQSYNKISTLLQLGMDKGWFVMYDVVKVSYGNSTINTVDVLNKDVNESVVYTEVSNRGQNIMMTVVYLSVGGFLIGVSVSLLVGLLWRRYNIRWSIRKRVNIDTTDVIIEEDDEDVKCDNAISILRKQKRSTTNRTMSRPINILNESLSTIAEASVETDYTYIEDGYRYGNPRLCDGESLLSC